MQVLVEAILSEYRFTPNIWKPNQLSITFLSTNFLNPSMSKHKQAPTQKRKRKNGPPKHVPGQRRGILMFIRTFSFADVVQKDTHWRSFY